MEFQILNFPVPPSVNQLYSNLGFNSGRRVKSKVYIQYQQSVRNWLAANLDKVQGARGLAQEVYGTAQVFHVETTFYMLRKDIICKNGCPKKNDTSNRLKALYDVLEDIVLGLDDLYFWSGTFHKIAVDDLKEVRVDMNFKLRKLE
jgi:hypothetical protein